MIGTPIPSRRSQGRYLVRFGVWLLAATVALAVLIAAAGVLLMRASLPQLDGARAAPGLAAAATVDRDEAGSAIVTAGNRIDLAYATGFAHGQDRYFQMDLMRRVAAGELAALVGASALPLDRRNRVHRFRARTDAIYAEMSEDQRRLLQRYADGVNDALGASRARPFEYLVLGTAPVQWRPQDTLLVIDAMYLNLQAGQLGRVLSRGALREQVPPDLLAFLAPRSSRWDAPMDGVAPAAARPDVPATRPDWLDDGPADAAGLPHAAPPHASGQPAAALATRLLASAGLDLHSYTGWPQPDPRAAVGSSAFAVAGSHGAGGRAQVANDMHLGLTLPNIWYRLTLQFPDPDGSGRQRRVSGVSLPGAPVVVAGSNGDVAWGFTNAYGHFLDLVSLERNPAEPRRCQGPASEWETAREYVETIEVKGQGSVTQTVYETRWGPILEVAGRTYAVRWVAYQPGATDLGLMAMEDARDVEQALRVAQTAGVPTQNILVADRGGRIGWTLAGPLPRATLDAGAFPVAANQADVPAGRLAPEAYPRILDPAGGRLWSGNSTQLGDPEQQRLIGDGGADMGARATQIRDALLARDAANEADLMAIQLDDRALWLAPWRKLALDTLDEAALRDHPARATYRRIVAEWNGRADAASVGYTLVRDFHEALYEAWFGNLDQRLADSAPGMTPPLSLGRASSRVDAVMEVLASHQAWVPKRHADWRAFMLDRIDAAIARNSSDGARLEDARWGERNRLAMGHAFARLAPEPLRGWLSAPGQPMSGDTNMPLIQHASFGASERFVVSPGREDEGRLHMPGGASGHPLSPFFLAGHEDWVNGTPAPFLPSRPVHRLELRPSESGG